ncbi:MFS transporter [Nonomuraea longicatena]|uniref:MFS transporter n=1 Tax=Nonomuraea longicatena TaxID=83682 RepID=A0ABN1QGW0_9ACTN
MPTPRDRMARVGTFVVFAVQGLSLATVLTQVETQQTKHHLDTGELTLILLIVPVLAGVGSLAAGALAARRGSRWLLRLAQPTVAVAVVATGFAPTVPVLLAALVLFGLGVGAVDAGMNMQGVAIERRYGRAVLNGFHCMGSAAALAGALWAVLAARLELGLAVTTALPMALAVAGCVASGPLLCPPEDDLRAASTPVRLPWRPIVPLCLAMGFLYVGDAAVSNFSAVYMADALKAPPAGVALAYTAYQAATLAVRLCGDLVVRRFGPAAVVGFGGVLATLGFAGVVAAPTVTAAVVAFGLTGVGLSVVAPQAFSAAGRLDPAGSGVAVARVNLFNYVGFVAGAAAVGGLADLTDPKTAFAVPMALAAAVVLLARGFAPRTTRFTG